MKLIYEGDRIKAVATQEYVGPDLFVDAPEGFDLGRLAEYRLIDGQVVIPPPPLPTSITPRQARLALLGAGLLEQIQAAFAQLPEPEKTAASIEWEYASSIERSSPLVAQMAAVAGLTDEQVDELFAAGAAL